MDDSQGVVTRRRGRQGVSTSPPPPLPPLPTQQGGPSQHRQHGDRATGQAKHIRRRSTTANLDIHTNGTVRAEIDKRLSADECWMHSAQNGFLGSNFDAVDMSPCDMRFQDTTTCGCAMPCRVGTFDVLSKLTNDDVEPGLKKRCYPESLIKFLEDYKRSTKHLDAPERLSVPRQFFRWLMLAPPDGVAVDTHVGPIGKLKRSPVFDHPDKKVRPLGRAPLREETVNSVVDTTESKFYDGGQLDMWARQLAGVLTGLASSPALPKLPSSWDFFIHYGGFVTFPDAVGIDLCVTELLSLDEAEGKFEVMFDLQLTWFDSSLKTLEWEAQLQEAEGSALLVTSYCAPRVKIKDVLDGDTGWEDHNHVAEEAKLIAPGVVTKTIRLRSTIRDDNPIHDFPFDAQELTVELELLQAENPSALAYGLFAVPFTVRFEPQHELREWTMHTPVAHVNAPRGHTQTMVCAFRVTRKSTKYLVNNVLVLFLLSMLSFYAFVIPIDSANDRGSVTVTLLLTAISFQQFLADSLPKMSYLVLLDKYILACFGTIFIIAIENVAVAFLTGIEKTVSCGMYIADVLNGGGECIYNNESYFNIDMNDATAVNFEWYFLTIMVTLWVGTNVYFFLRMVGLMHRNYVMFGPALRERHTDKTDYTSSSDTILADALKGAPEGKLREARSELENFFGCRRFHGVGFGYDARHQAGVKAGCRASMIEGSVGPEVLLSFTRTVEENELMAVLLNAGCGRRASTALMPALLKYGLNVERLQGMDTELVSELLERMNIPLGKRMDIIDAARLKQGVLFLQGSASYMMKELNLDGKLVTKEDLFSALAQAMRKGDGDQEGWKVSFKITNLANFLYTISVMSSTVTPAMYIISKRKCAGLFNTPIYSQLWAGYGAWISENMTEEEGSKHVLIVDIGSGEMKRFHCILQRNRPLKQKAEVKDTESIAKYEDVLKEMVKDVTIRLKGEASRPSSRASADASSGTDTGTEASEIDWGVLLKKKLEALSELLVSDRLREMYIDAETNQTRQGRKSLPIPHEVHFIATSATRSFFEHVDKNETVTSPVAKEAKEIVLEAMRSTLDALIGEKLPGCDHVSFRILDHAEEAFHEYAAAKTACQYAIDLDPIVKASGLPVTLAWGSGSTQGFCWQPPSAFQERGKKEDAVDAADDVFTSSPGHADPQTAPRTRAAKSGKSRIDSYRKPLPTTSGMDSVPTVPDTSSESIQVTMGLNKVKAWIKEWAAAVTLECDNHLHEPVVLVQTIQNGKKKEEWISFASVDTRKELESAMRLRIRNELRGDITTRPIKVFDATV